MHDDSVIGRVGERRGGLWFVLIEPEGDRSVRLPKQDMHPA